jgi:hypothetical protein
MSDPMGKRALYSVPDAPSAAGPPTATISKESLFSASEEARRFGTVVVECSTCGARSRLGWGEFTRRHLPFWLWFPWLRYSQFMSCPACDRRTWLGVSWFA